MNELLKQWEQRLEELRLSLENKNLSIRGHGLLSGKYYERRDAIKELRKFLESSEQSPVKPNEIKKK